MDQNKATRAVFLIMMVTLISKVLGFVREILLGSTYGASSTTDAYLISLTVPTILFTCIASAIATTYIPVYAEIRSKHAEEYGLLFTNKLINIVVVFSTILTVLGILLTRPIVSLIAMGFDDSTLDLAIGFTKVTFPMMIFIGLTYVFVGFLQSNNQFLAPASINIPNNSLLIGILSMSSIFGMNGLLIGTLVGAVFQVLIQLPAAKRKGFKYKFIIDISDPYIKKIGLLAVPVVIGVAVQQINTLVDRALASGLVAGSISALNFANRLNGFVFGIFSVSISTAMYPLLSSLTNQGDYDKLKEIFVKTINLISILMIPITVGAVVLRVPIVSVLFERGQFDHHATLMTASALLFYSLGMVFFGYRDILNRVFFSLQDTKTPMVNGIIAVISNIILNLILVKYLQHSGLALATSITAALTTLLLFANIQKKIGHVGGKSIGVVFCKALIASVMMGITISLLNNHVFVTSGGSGLQAFITLFAMIVIGSLIYALMLVLFKVEEFQWGLEQIKNKFHK